MSKNELTSKFIDNLIYEEEISTNKNTTGENFYDDYFS